MSLELRPFLDKGLLELLLEGSPFGLGFVLLLGNAPEAGLALPEVVDRLWDALRHAAGSLAVSLRPFPTAACLSLAVFFGTSREDHRLVDGKAASSFFRCWSLPFPLDLAGRMAAADSSQPE